MWKLQSELVGLKNTVITLSMSAGFQIHNFDVVKHCRLWPAMLFASLWRIYSMNGFMTLKEAEEMLKDMSAAEIAGQLGICRATLFKRLKSARDEHIKTGKDPFIL